MKKFISTIVFVIVMAPALQVYAIVNGTEAKNPEFQAVVSLDGCTGTFVHPNFILTAAHCLPQCTGRNDTGCVTGSSHDVFMGDAVGRDGAVTGITASDGVDERKGARYAVDYVYFARAADIDRRRAPDVALLRTKTPFRGKVIPVLPHQDRPKPDESNYCRRWEYTWPWVLGYSPNAGATDARRRIGRAFAECDLEMDETVFKLDGHGRSGQRGIRTCRGDSGGPVLWETGFGGFAVGGVNSGTDHYRVLTDTRCPSDRGEGFHAFIPSKFLDRVARTDRICGGAGTWESCPDQPVQYGGYQLEYLGTEIDQCGRTKFGIHNDLNSVDVWIGHGRTGASEVGRKRFRWFCGDSTEWSTARRNTRFVIGKRAVTDRQVIWDTYRVRRRPTDDTDFKKIKNPSREKCLNLQIHADKNGGVPNVWECTDHPDQEWRLRNIGGGLYKIENFAWGKCLNLQDHANVNGGLPNVWDCTDHPDQEWKLRSIGGGLYQIENHAWGKCLNLQDHADKNGGLPNVWDCADHPDQQWMMYDR